MRTGHEGSHTARDPPPCSSAAGRAAVGENLEPGGQGSTRRGLAGNVTTHRPAHLRFAHFVKRKYWLPPPRSTPPLSPPGSRRHRGSAFNAAARGGPHGASGGAFHSCWCWSGLSFIVAQSPNQGQDTTEATGSTWLTGRVWARPALFYEYRIKLYFWARCCASSRIFWNHPITYPSSSPLLILQATPCSPPVFSETAVSMRLSKISG